MGLLPWHVLVLLSPRRACLLVETLLNRLFRFLPMSLKNRVSQSLRQLLLRHPAVLPEFSSQFSWCFPKCIICPSIDGDVVFRSFLLNLQQFQHPHLARGPSCILGGAAAWSGGVCTKVASVALRDQTGGGPCGVLREASWRPLRGNG